jgi:hypothetical protein
MGRRECPKYGSSVTYGSGRRIIDSGVKNGFILTDWIFGGIEGEKGNF